MTQGQTENPYNKYKFFSTADPLCIYKALKILNSEVATHSYSDDDKFIVCSTFTEANVISVCKKFNKLISLLCNTNTCLDMDKSLKDGVYEYMNFWLNHELNLNNKNASALIEKYNETLKTVNEGAYKFQKLVGKLNYIDKTNLAGMKLLNELYTYYYEINDIPSKGASHENRLCSEKSQILANKYNIARNMCIDSNYGLYSALMEFKNNYEDVYEEVLNTGKCNSAHLIKLPSEYDILKISVNGLHKVTLKTMMSATLLGPIIVFFLLLIYFFMFTPLGTCVFVKERKKKKKFDIRDDNMQEMLQDAYHNGTRSANRKRLNILYNAS